MAKPQNTSDAFRKVQSHDWNELKEMKRLLKIENDMLRAKQSITDEKPLAILERIAIALEKIADADAE